MTVDALEKLIRRERIFPDLPKERYIDRFFSVLFWGYFAATYASFLLEHGEGGRRAGLLAGTLAFAGLALAWGLLPWNARVPGYRLLAAPAFLALSFLVVYLTDFDLSFGLYSIAVANGVFLFGFRRAVMYAAALLALVFGDYLLTSPGLPLGGALERSVYWVPAFALVVGMCAMTQRALERQKRAQGLLGELEAANAELRRYADRVKELAISEERARMAREMHDSLGHHLTAVDLQLKTAAKLLGRDPDLANEALVRADGAAREAIKEVRRAIRALRPLGIEERRGAGALAALVKGFEGTGVAVSFEVEGEERNLPPEVELVLYRTLQEGLTNALKHSGASRVEARLALSPSRARLTVSDDGQGTAPEEIEVVPGGGYGLPSIKERAEALGGSFAAGGTEGGGFSLGVELPVGEV